MAGPFLKRHFLIPRNEIGYLRFILEGYDGLAFSRSLDGRSGLVEIAYPPSRRREAEALIAALAEEIAMQEQPDVPEEICRGL